MEVTDNLVLRIAELAKLEFNAEELVEIKQDLKRMIDFVGQLDEVDTTGIEPLIFMSPETNVWREDKSETIITHEEAMSNAPKRDSDYFKVPKVIGKED
ncbi:MAG: Asp-tRNA(Asn)/Glu-tRNA(Gln) amidotransferase subunit GatC [Methylococcales bacterium]|nr:Asp-tRNA(Asn)/Glu-tRNA(Gln) amidotransferase subunit GatC [Methylococcales bacterium]